VNLKIKIKLVNLIQTLAYQVELVTLDAEVYELIPEPEQGFSEDPANVAEVITEALNQSSKVFDIPDPSPAQEGKP
jgi:hypothetical protein